MSNFPIRNRIISAIADGVLVIEAEHRSGSKITAKYAEQQGKKVYCIPMNLDAKNSSGIMELINDNAKIITSPTHLIRDLFTNIEEDTQLNIIEEPKVKPQKIEKPLQISKEQKEILEILENEKMTRDEIAERLNKNISDINSILTLMEIKGLVKQVEGNNFCKID